MEHILVSNMMKHLELNIISVTYCEQKLSKLCVHKAMGPDNIRNWILKDFSYILAAPIAAIYNSSVRQSYVPPSWKQAEILPIPKVSQVTSLAKHLRPIERTWPASFHGTLYKCVSTIAALSQKLARVISTTRG